MTDTTLNIRKVDADAVARAKRAAGARGLTLGRYFERLVALHEGLRDLANDNGRYVYLQEYLAALGLETVDA